MLSQFLFALHDAGEVSLNPEADSPLPGAPHQLAPLWAYRGHPPRWLGPEGHAKVRLLVSPTAAVVQPKLSADALIFEINIQFIKLQSLVFLVYIFKF